MRGRVLLVLIWVFAGTGVLWAVELPSLSIPQIGESTLRILSPTILELELITVKDKDPAPVQTWNFVTPKPEFQAPPIGAFEVLVDGKPVLVEKLGFRRRVVYAPLRKRDLRLGNHIFLSLAAPIPAGKATTVEVRNPGNKLWAATTQFQVKADPGRFSPVIHVNQTGYAPELPKKAMLGYYLGTMGELIIPGQEGFDVVELKSGKTAFHGSLRRRPDKGYTFRCYEQVVEADFSPLTNAGWYQVRVNGFGTSYPFKIGNETLPEIARTLALGIYHQRCGGPNELPYTRFTHGPCHIAPAEVPDESFKAVGKFLADMSSDYKSDTRHIAPQLKTVNASLYPFVRKGRIDVAGGHHDAGDYSKYTINSASFIHHLVFAADAFPGAGALDDLGLPESGDGKSDLLQEAKWEADFLAKMQDDDGGFYFLVYPKERAYEDDVLPDRGDAQVVFPKNTAVTAAAVAALAQTASSPLFQKQFPEAADLYLRKAKRGWAFLQKAFSQYGHDGSYQKLTHYGNEFLHDDELAWAAAEMYIATGDKAAADSLVQSFDPTNRDTKRWTWWRMFEAYGNAIRSSAFAAQTGRKFGKDLDPAFLKKCQQEIIAAAQDQVRFTAECAYGTAFPDPSKRFRSAGWYFSLDRAFDIAAVAALQSPEVASQRPVYTDAMISNLNYENGCNPVNVSFITGLGWKRQREIVHHYAQNDDRALPPSGIPLGNVQSGFMFLHHYQKELGQLSFPADGAEDNPYPFYDRWGDSFNTSAEFVIVNQARELATLAYLIGNSPAVKKPAARPQLTISTTGKQFTATLNGKPLPAETRVVWEAQGQEPRFGEFQSGARATFNMLKSGTYWVEAEAELPDGHRASARTSVKIP